MKNFWTFCLVAFSITTTQTTLACECTEPAKLKATIKESTKIFLGKMLSVSDEPHDSSYFWVNFSVQKSWKGATKKRTRVKVAGGKSCGYEFVKGKTYLVFSSNLSPYTSSCGWTKPADIAVNTIKILGHPRARF